MRRLYHDVPLYSGFAKPQFLDGNVFRLIVPLNDGVPSASEMEFPMDDDSSKTRVENEKARVENEKTRVKNEKTRVKILNLMAENPFITADEIAKVLSITKKGVEWQLKKLRDENAIRHAGSTKGGHWEIIKESESSK